MIALVVVLKRRGKGAQFPKKKMLSRETPWARAWEDARERIVTRDSVVEKEMKWRWSQVDKVFAERGCWIRLDWMTKRLEPIYFVNSAEWFFDALKNCIGQSSTSLLSGWIVKGLIIRLFFRFSLGAFTTNARQPPDVESPISKFRGKPINGKERVPPSLLM